MAVVARRGPWRPQDLEVLIEKVWFEDGTVWRRGASGTLDFRPSPLLQGMRLQVMQELAGAGGPASYPSDQGKVWVCVCGRADAAREEECRRCRRNKHDIFTKFDEASHRKDHLPASKRPGGGAAPPTGGGRENGPGQGKADRKSAAAAAGSS